MKLIIIFSLILSVACSQKPKSGSSIGDQLTKADLTVFEGCSVLDASLKEIWILLCQKSPHPQRFEIYEYSQFFKTFKRLTFQDGLIRDIAVSGFDNIIYSSTFDESKEQFLAVSKGYPAGTDLYLRKRSSNDFERITTDLGSDHSLFWSEKQQSLFFIHSNDKGHAIRKMDKSRKVSNLISPQKTEILSPISLAPGSLHWIQSDEQNKLFFLIKAQKNRKPKPLFQSPTRMTRLAPGQNFNQVLITFATDLGTELWSLELDTFCWKSILRTQSKWNRFQIIDVDTLYISVEKENQFSIQKVRPNSTHDQVCQPSPTGLGVVVL
jgi:hypothetical protein